MDSIHCGKSEALAGPNMVCDVTFKLTPLLTCSVREVVDVKPPEGHDIGLLELIVEANQ